MFLEITQNSQENTYARVSFLVKLQAKDWNFIKKGTLAQVFFCEFCEICKKIFFAEHIPASAFENVTTGVNTYYKVKANLSVQVISTVNLIFWFYVCILNSWIWRG